MSALRSACLLASLLATAWAAGQAFAAGPPAALGFQGARLGMSLKDWRAVPVPQGAGDAVPICTNEDKTVRIPGYPLSAEDVRTGVVACGYKARFGHDVFNHSIAIDPSFTAQSVAYVFRGGRLDQIRFTASTDAYGDIRKVFALKRWAKGAGIGRRGVSRTRTWRAPGGQVRIARGPNPSELTVDLLRRR
jgi:hypothetical protein